LVRFDSAFFSLRPIQLLGVAGATGHPAHDDPEGLWNLAVDSNPS
jgi:hypothetical protein